MPKSLYRHSPKDKGRKAHLRENFVPFLNFQLKNELMLGFTTLWNTESNLQKSKDLVPAGVFAAFTSTYNQISKVLHHMNEITTLITLLKELEENYPAQPQKMRAEIQFVPIIKKYQHEAQAQGIHFVFNHDIIENNVYGGKVEFEHILEPLLANALERTKKGTIEVTLLMADTKLLFYIKGKYRPFHQAKDLRPFKISQKNTLIHDKNTLSKIRIYLAKKLVEKIHGSMEIVPHDPQNGNEIRVEIPIKISEK